MGQRAEEILTAARVITPDQVHAPGWLAVEDGNVTALGSGAPPSPARDLGPVTITPGFIDLHCHGGGGASFGEGPDAAERALAMHRRHGTTSTVASLATDRLDSLAKQLADLAPLVSSGQLVGVHLEGPWLSPVHPGAHDVSLLRDPD